MDGIRSDGFAVLTQKESRLQAIAFRGKRKEDADSFQRQVRSAKDNYASHHASTTTVIASKSQEIAKYKEQFDTGAITAEKFTQLNENAIGTINEQPYRNNEKRACLGARFSFADSP